MCGRVADERLRPAVGWAQIRFGKILEDLDVHAGSVAYRHADDSDPNTELPTIVTASCDRIDLLNPLTPDRDYMVRWRWNIICCCVALCVSICVLCRCGGVARMWAGHR